MCGRLCWLLWTVLESNWMEAPPERMPAPIALHSGYIYIYFIRKASFYRLGLEQVF